ncbi:MAG: 2-hydroxychromene-2-carboxylate isomerase [Proteobacteria bacterium]|nr:2-hydroxychromene-2-carboxylate isomerase [Pseudomonadota bacterium]
MRQVTLYFDFVSPFSYIAFKRLHELPRSHAVELKPVLFAALLNHFGQKGPAEIAGKRRWTYRWCTWWAQSLGIPFRFPAAHPFNPLHHLRLAIAAGTTPQNVGRIFDAIWTTGAEASDPGALKALALALGVDDARLAATEVKDALRKNTEDAIARGVFGVPTYEVEGELFWGADSIGFLNAFLADPAVLNNEEMRRADGLPVGAARKA